MIVVFNSILLLIIYTISFGYWFPMFRNCTAVYSLAVLDPQDGDHEVYNHACLLFDKASHHISLPECLTLVS